MALHVMPLGRFTYDDYVTNASSIGLALSPSTARDALQPLAALGLIEQQRGSPASKHAFVSHVPLFLVRPIAAIVESHRREYEKDDRTLRKCAATLLAFLYAVVEDPRAETAFGQDALIAALTLIQRIEQHAALDADETKRARRTHHSEIGHLFTMLFETRLRP